MPDGKTETINVRVRPDVKRLLQEAAECESRSQTKLLETPIRDHCRKLGLVAMPRVNRTKFEE